MNPSVSLTQEFPYVYGLLLKEEKMLHSPVAAIKFKITCCSLKMVHFIGLKVCCGFWVVVQFHL